MMQTKQADEKFSRESTKDPVALSQQFGSEQKDLARYKVTIYPTCVLVELFSSERKLKIETDSLKCCEGTVE